MKAGNSHADVGSTVYMRLEHEIPTVANFIIIYSFLIKFIHNKYSKEYETQFSKQLNTFFIPFNKSRIQYEIQYPHVNYIFYL